MALQDGDGTGRRINREAIAQGGVITFRVALAAIAGLTLYLLEAIGSDLNGQLHRLNDAQSEANGNMATLTQKVTDIGAMAAHNSDRVDDHEHRITILEARDPHHP